VTLNHLLAEDHPIVAMALAHHAASPEQLAKVMAAAHPVLGVAAVAHFDRWDRHQLDLADDCLRSPPALPVATTASRPQPTPA